MITYRNAYGSLRTDTYVARISIASGDVLFVAIVNHP